MRRVHVGRLAAVLGLLAATGCYAELADEPGTAGGECERAFCVPGSCGVVTDGCGAVIDCGHCGPSQICVQDELGGICIPCDGVSCEELGAECGQVSNGCGAMIYCGDCADGPCGSDGTPNRCPCSPAPRLLEQATADPVYTYGSVYSGDPLVTLEAGIPYLYFSTSLWNPGPELNTSLARARLQAPWMLDPQTIEPIPGTLEGLGTAANPAICSSGRELFFDSTRPDDGWYDPELYLSSRARVEEPWGLPVPLTGLGDPATPDDGVNSPLLLPDGVTLLYWSHREQLVETAQRASNTPGDPSFVPLAEAAFQDPLVPPGELAQLGGFSLSCDGAYVLYMLYRRGGTTSELRQVELLGLSPPSFGVPEPYSRILGELTSWDGEPIARFVEAPDCASVYVATYQGNLFQRATSCPR